MGRVEINWWQIRKRDSDLERELRSDLELEEEEQRERGLPGDAEPMTMPGTRRDGLAPTPIGFEEISHQAIVRIDAHVSALGQFRFIAGPLDLLPAKTIALLQLCL